MYNRVQDWLDEVLKQDIPNEVAGFCFNLYEDGDCDWSMELVGTESFDEDDEDWACGEITDFGTRTKPLMWKSESEWEHVLEDSIFALKTYLENGKYAEVLRGRSGVGVGFVDGNIEIVYKNNGM